LEGGGKFVKTHAPTALPAMTDTQSTSAGQHWRGNRRFQLNKHGRSHAAMANFIAWSRDCDRILYHGGA